MVKVDKSQELIVLRSSSGSLSFDPWSLIWRMLEFYLGIQIIDNQECLVLFSMYNYEFVSYKKATSYD